VALVVFTSTNERLKNDLSFAEFDAQSLGHRVVCQRIVFGKYYTPTIRHRRLERWFSPTPGYSSDERQTDQGHIDQALPVKMRTLSVSSSDDRRSICRRTVPTRCVIRLVVVQLKASSVRTTISRPLLSPCQRHRTA